MPRFRLLRSNGGVPPPVIGEPIVFAQPAPDAVVEEASTSDGRVRCARHRGTKFQCKRMFVPVLTRFGKPHTKCEQCRSVQKRYNMSEKGKLTQNRKNSSDKGKARMTRFKASDKGKAWEKNDRKSEKRKARDKRFFQSDKGKACTKRQNDKLSHRILCRIWGMCRDGAIQSMTALTATGCATNEELRAHFESTFEPWMNWNNQGRKKAGGNSDAWQIGHHLAKAFYDDSNPVDIKRCWNKANLFAQDADENHALKVTMPDDTTLERLRALNLLPCAWNGIVPPVAQRAAMERTVSLKAALR